MHTASDPRRITLVRHAVTQDNLDRIRAHDEAGILPVGRVHARALARRLRHCPVDAIWSSPMRRALETARIIGAELDLPVRVDADLRDLDCGPWTGLSDAEIASLYPAEYEVWNSTPSQMSLPGHESLLDLRARVVSSLERLRTLHPATLCVTHLGPIRVAVLHCRGQPLDGFGAIDVEHCSAVELSGTVSGCRLRRLA